MKKRTLCLLLAGVMALSLLSGCGGKPTGGDAESSAPGSENVSAGDEQNSGPASGNVDSLTRDSRWDTLQPGETALQYHDVFIKSGMTLGEAMEAMDRSEYEFTTTFEFSLDDERTCSGDGSAQANSFYAIRFWPDTVFNVCYLEQLPGEPGTTYTLRDCPIYAVFPGSAIAEGKIPDELVTRIGTAGELKAMDQETIQGVVETALAGMGAELSTRPITHNGVEVMSYHYDYFGHFSWNGYTLRSAGREEGFMSNAHFEIAVDTGKVNEKGTLYIDSSERDDVLVWVPETGGQNTPEQSAPAADVGVPRFDHLAVQYHDVVITPGMTLGEAMKAVDDSELPLTYSDMFSPEKLKQEFEVPKTDSYTVSGTDVTFAGQLGPDDFIFIECDGENVFSIKYSKALPGEPGTTYRMEDLLVLGANISMSSSDEYAADEIRTFLGTGAEISSLSAEEIESIFAQEGAELTVEPDTYEIKDENGNYIPVPVQTYEARIRFVPQWNGYKLYSSHRDGISEGYTQYSFKIDEDGNMLGWSVFFSRSGMTFWTADDVE